MFSGPFCLRVAGAEEDLGVDTMEAAVAGAGVALLADRCKDRAPASGGTSSTA